MQQFMNPAQKNRPKIRYWLPQAAVDEQDLREELRQLAARGFGGVEIVSMIRRMPDELFDSDYAWGKEQWHRVLGIIDDECQKNGMTMDVANGPQWPIAMPCIQSADDPAALYELTYGEASFSGGRYSGPLPERRVVRGEGTPKLLHVLAYREVGDHALDQDSYTDLTGMLHQTPDGLRVDVSLPPGGPGEWRLFAFWQQPAAQKVAERFYVIDHLSAAGARACANYWDTLLAEQPLPAMTHIFCDSLEHHVSLDWAHSFAEEFQKRRGYSILPYLPVIGAKGTYPISQPPGYHFADSALSDAVNNDYFETLTECYTAHHLIPLQQMAERHGLGIRYQVAYNKPFEIERCGLFVDVPENEALGRSTIDSQKAMAAAVHLARKSRYSFECAAEFGNAYGQTFADIFWWIKRSLMAGMNHQVFHGASYSGGYQGPGNNKGLPPGAVWPGYEAFVKFCSNYWNRTLSAEHARGCLDAVTRMNAVFGLPCKIDIAIYRQSYLNDGLGDDGGHIYPDGACLQSHGYTYEFLSPYLLGHENARVEKGVLDAGGAAYRALIVPFAERMSSSALSRILQLIKDGLTVVWLGAPPSGPLHYSDGNDEAKRQRWQRLAEALRDSRSLLRAETYADIPRLLEENGVFPRLRLPGRPKDVLCARRDGGTSLYYALHRYNPVAYIPELGPDVISWTGWRGIPPEYLPSNPAAQKQVDVCMEGIGRVYRLDVWSGGEEAVPFTVRDNQMQGSVSIGEGELVILRVATNEAPDCCEKQMPALPMSRQIDVHLSTLTLREFGPATPGEGSFLRGKFKEPRVLSISMPLPWCELETGLAVFSGEGIYGGGFVLPSGGKVARATLRLDRVCDTFSVKINGRMSAFPDQTKKQVDITALLREGHNDVEITVYSTLRNALLKDFADSPKGPQGRLDTAPQKYGVWRDNGEYAVSVAVEY